MKNVLICEHLLKDSVNFCQRQWLKKSYAIDYCPHLKEDEILEKLSKGNYDALIVRNKVISRSIIEAWSSAKKHAKLAIVRAGSNISTIDVKAAQECNVVVMNTPGANSQAVSQYIISQLFMLSGCFNNCVTADQDIKNSVYHDKGIYASHTFIGDTIAVIGTGYIGSKVAIIANSLGMKVKAYSPGFTENKAEEIGAIYCNSLKEAVTDAHFITVQVPYTLNDAENYPKTIGMIDHDILKQAVNNAKLISVSRKDVINISDLDKSLKNNQIGRVSLDLLQSEIKDIATNYPDIISNPNNIITPLIACESYKADNEITTQALKKVELFLDQL